MPEGDACVLTSSNECAGVPPRSMILSFLI
jgi:hypothetical protein